MRTVTYPSGRKIEYDENTPCIICGEPVISASIGGTVICPACDLGKCRYCGMTVFVLKKEIDGGKSKENLLRHMRWHHTNTVELVKRVNSASRKANEIFDNKVKMSDKQPTSKEKS